LSAEAPYRHHPFELGFGVLRADGSEKPAAGAVRAAGEWVRALDWDALDFFAPRAAIVRPSYLETTYPFSWEERSRMVHGLLSAYALARKAGLQAQVVPETHSLDRYDLILVPSTQKLLAPTWEKILLRAADGATVYWSYFGGDYDFHQGMWCHLFETLSGCRHRLRYGVPDVPATEVVELLGDGLALRARAAGGPFARSLLPIEPAGAPVVARDTAGRAALTQHAVGRGTVFFLAYPWEFYLGEQVAPEDTSHALYAYLAAAAGVAPAYPASDPRVHTHLVRAAREDLVWALNRSWDPVEAEVDAPGGGGAFAPKEGRVLRAPGGWPSRRAGIAAREAGGGAEHHRLVTGHSAAVARALHAALCTAGAIEMAVVPAGDRARRAAHALVRAVAFAAVDAGSAARAGLAARAAAHVRAGCARRAPHVTAGAARKVTGRARGAHEVALARAALGAAAGAGAGASGCAAAVRAAGAAVAARGREPDRKREHKLRRSHCFRISA